MSEIAELRRPSMAGVLEAAVGTRGKVLIPALPVQPRSPG